MRKSLFIVSMFLVIAGSSAFFAAARYQDQLSAEIDRNAQPDATALSLLQAAAAADETATVDQAPAVHEK